MRMMLSTLSTTTFSNRGLVMLLAALALSSLSQLRCVDSFSTTSSLSISFSFSLPQPLQCRTGNSLSNNRMSAVGGCSNRPLRTAFGRHPLYATDADTTSTSSSSSYSFTPSNQDRFEKACVAFEAAHAEDPRMITINTEEEEEEEEQQQQQQLPYSVHYHRRMAYWLDRLSSKDGDNKDIADTATTTSTSADNDSDINIISDDEILQLAVRCQHIRRWTRPRADYPTGLVGYKKWRSDLAVFHSQQAASILVGDDESCCSGGCGYPAMVTDRLAQLLQKVNLTTDPIVQLFEDVICVTFLENEYTAFVEKNKNDNDNEDDTYIYMYSEDKLVDIVRKTWKKMTPRGHAAALQLAGQLSERGLAVVQRALEEE